MGKLSEIEEQIYTLAGCRFSICNYWNRHRALKGLPPDRRDKLEKLIASYRAELRLAGERAENNAIKSHHKKYQKKSGQNEDNTLTFEEWKKAHPDTHTTEDEETKTGWQLFCEDYEQYRAETGGKKNGNNKRTV